MCAPSWKGRTRQSIVRLVNEYVIYGYTVLEAEHGKQALALCHTNRPACLILDYRLPDDDRLALLQRLAAAAHPHLYPVVMLTGVDDVAIAVQAIQRGVHDYLNKIG